MRVRRRTLLLALPGLIGFFLLCFSTRSGFGVSPDSVQYLYAARSIAEGQGVRDLYDDQGKGPYTHAPPAFPAVVAVAAAAFGEDPFLRAGSWLNRLLFALGAFVLGWSIERITRSMKIALVAGLFVLCGVDWFSIHEMIWTEPMYFLTSYLGLWYLSSAISTGSRRDLWLTIGFIAVSCLTRYAGMTLLLVLWIALLWSGPETLPRRFFRASGATLLAATPLSLWMARNALLSGNPTDRGFTYHPMDGRVGKELLLTVGEFCLQVVQTKEQSCVVGALMIAGVVILLLIQRKAFGRFLDSAVFPRILFLYSFVFLLFLAVSNTFFDITPLYFRIIDPILVNGVVIAAAWYHTERDRVKGWMLRHAWLHVALSLALVSHVYEFARYLIRKDSPSGYFASSWKQSEVLAEVVRSGPEGLYTNAVDAVFVHGGGIASGLDGLAEAKAGARVAIFREGAFAEGSDFEHDRGVFKQLPSGGWLDTLRQDACCRMYVLRMR